MQIVVRYICLPVVLVSGCAASSGSLQPATSSQTGCAPRDIVIADYVTNDPVASWSAQCQGKKFYCSGPVSLNDRISCHEQQPEAKPQATGEQENTQNKTNNTRPAGQGSNPGSSAAHATRLGMRILRQIIRW